MIKTLADLLESIKHAEAEKLNELNIKHRPTIGNTYEGLTASLLQRALFTGLKLNVITNSFIKYNSGMSMEFDIMVIEGEGQLIPYTKGQYQVSYEQVIAVIQVKKRITKNQLEESYKNLKNIYDILDDNNAPSHSINLFKDAYKSICGESIIEGNTYRKNFSTSTNEQIFHMLKLESIMPARITFGYEGYSSEYSLREGFVKFLEDNAMKQGFAPINFPDLIINGDYSLFKANGMPYVGKLIGNQWPFYLSDSSNAIHKMIELLWTRLTYRFNLSSDIFDDDLQIEQANLYLRANIVNVSGMRGWNFEYTPLSNTDLQKKYEPQYWEPAKLTKEQFIVINHLCKEGSLKKNDLRRLLSSISNDNDEDEFVEGLLNTGLVNFNHNKLQLLTDMCQCVILPDGNYYAGENKAGLLTKWMEKKMIELKKQ